MRFPRLIASALAVSLAIGAAVAPAGAADPIKIGELNSYTSLPSFTIPYRNGWQLAVEEINAKGGVLGRMIDVASRDDGGKPADALTAANELVGREKVSILTGTLLSNVGLALADFAKQKKLPFIAAEPLTDTIAWENGNAWTFRLRPGTWVQAAMLAEEAAKLPAKKWVTVAPNYEYGKSAVEAFKTLLKQRRPDVEFIGEQWPAYNRIEAGPTVEALKAMQPEAIYNVTFGADLTKFVREGTVRGLFEGREVVSILGGEPDWIDPLGAEAPKGWIVTGYPWYAIKTPEHEAFLKAYQARFKDYPRLGSVVGYASMYLIAAAVEKAGGTDPEKLAAAMRGLKLPTPLGEIEMRKSDQQSTMGTYVGRLTVENDMPRMVDWRFGTGNDYLPSEAEAAKKRPKD